MLDMVFVLYCIVLDYYIVYIYYFGSDYIVLSKCIRIIFIIMVVVFSVGNKRYCCHLICRAYYFN